jgi:hypothetical protein
MTQFDITIEFDFILIWDYLHSLIPKQANTLDIELVKKILYL